jgi:prepilin signal peptidase PulO-like enzyme (type II secretory pathway)
VVIGQEEALFLFSSPEFWLLAIGLRLLFIILLYDIKEYELHLTASVLLLLISAIAQRALGYNLRAMLQGMIIFFCVFLAIYYGGKLLVRWKYKKKAEGFGFGDVIIAGILGSIFPVFIAPSGIIEWVYFICSYLIISSVLGIGTFFIKNFSSPKPKEDKQTIPFLPAMIIAFVLFILYGDTLLNFLLSFN